MAEIVNLDALIPREDFAVLTEQANSQPIQTIQIRDLERDTFFYSAVRKPDFQRETNEWGIARISDFVKSFLDGDLIPAIILWQGGGNIFVIDGSHRLSSLASWVQDDYGDGLVSRLFYNSVIPPEQAKAADKTRHLVKQLVGSYQDHKDAIVHPDQFPSEVVARARRLASLALQLQWVKGDASKAEASFFKINQQAVPIDKTELLLLQSRNKPNSLAARAIIRSGTGHKYWSRFDDAVQAEIEDLARAINELLFTPELRSPIKTLDLPVAGRGYSSQTLPLVFDLVNLCNNVATKKIVDDPNGAETIIYLKNCHRILNRITGVHPSSLGLHPIVYFYSGTGRYQPTSFFAMVSLMKELDENNQLRDFTSARRKFEDFLLLYKILPLQVVYKYGSGMKGYLPTQALFAYVLKNFINGKDENQIVANLVKDKRFSYLQPQDVSGAESQPSNFSSETKSAVFLRDALKDPLRCAICGGLIHFNSISIDHIQRRQDGGLGTVDNAQLTHPYCNTTIKN
ncbi:MAG: HNH endonuclease family protein [Dehalococcoidia bacterium]